MKVPFLITAKNKTSFKKEIFVFMSNVSMELWAACVGLVFPSLHLLPFNDTD